MVPSKARGEYRLEPLNVMMWKIAVPEILSCGLIELPGLSDKF